MNKKALDHSLQFLDSWLAFRYDRTDTPGYVVAVAYKGQVLFSKAYGYADLEKKTKLTPGHLFRIASHSKTFTASALMLLQERGKLRIDDYVIDYVPWLKQHKDSRWQKVTLRQLMSHGAGIIRDGQDADYWQLERPFPNAGQLRQEILEARLVLDNNVQLKYSNYGYSLLGYVIEAVAGEPYNAFVTKHIVEPLGLEHTGPEFTPAIEDQLVTGYSLPGPDKKRLPIAQIDTAAMSPATGFYSNAADLCAYFSAHFTGSGKLLDDESKKEMQRTQWHANLPGQYIHMDYGLGHEIEFVGERRTIGHGGGFPGHITRSMADPKDELVVVVLTNALGSWANWINRGVWGVIDYFQANTPGGKPKHDLSRLEGRYMNLWETVDIVVTGDKVVSVWPDGLEIFSSPETLEYVDDATFKIVGTSSFGSEGELVRFNPVDGKVETVLFAGTTMWPEKAWLQKQRGRKIVG